MEKVQILKIDHLVITTANITACIHFYETLGFRAIDAGGRWELYAGDFKINVHIKGHELEPKASHIQCGSADLCFEITTNLEAYLNELKSKGIMLLSDIVDRHGVRGAMQSFYLYDMDGNLLEFSKYK